MNQEQVQSSCFLAGEVEKIPDCVQPVRFPSMKLKSGQGVVYARDNTSHLTEGRKQLGPSKIVPTYLA